MAGQHLEIIALVNSPKTPKKQINNNNLLVSKVVKKGLLSLPTKLRNYSTQIQYNAYMDRQFTGHWCHKV